MKNSKILNNKNLKEKKIMKHYKKIISSILTLTLFAGSVVSLSCFAADSNSDKPSTEQTQQEKSNDFDRCRGYANELDKIKQSVNKKSHSNAFDKAFERLYDLEKKLSENDWIVLADHVNATESYLNKTKDKAFQYADEFFKKTSSENRKLKENISTKNFALTLISVSLAIAMYGIYTLSQTNVSFASAMYRNYTLSQTNVSFAI